MKDNNSSGKKDLYNMHFGAEAFAFHNAEKLRKYQTESEYILWEQLKNKKLGGIKFRRQHPICRFVVDFYCHSSKLVIEIDGGIHKDTKVKENDKNRQAEIEELGLKVIRFSDSDVLFNTTKVLEEILAEVQIQKKLHETTHT
jgi:very-short-patch-repair endonuclease